ncbi:MAG: hypothetical protein OES57_13040 [Acidimicrobiia bacterium]|nr:hypothetical protein [Acidimicrobiia bacterium]
MSRRLPDPIGVTLVRVRLFAVRYRAVYWLVAVTLAVLAATLVHGHEQRAERVREAWGDTTSVLVLSTATEAGTDLTDGHVRRVATPEALVPETAVSDVEGAQVTRVRLGAGTIVTEDLLVAADDALASGRRGVALAITEATPPLSPGVAVDLVGEGTTLATEARVVRVADEQVVVAVEASEVAAVAAAARADNITIVLTS